MDKATKRQLKNTATRVEAWFDGFLNALATKPWSLAAFVGWSGLMVLIGVWISG